MRARTAASTLEDMLRNPFERAFCTRRSRDLRCVPRETKALKERAHLDMLRQSGIELDQQRAHLPVTQGLFHASNDPMLESVDVDLHVIGRRHLARGNQIVEA